MPASALFGVETEYAVNALDARGRPLPVGELVGRFRDRAAARPHLPGVESGIFLSNGARFYVDVGDHPEYAAPETTDPGEAVRYSFAGDRLMAELAQEIAREDPGIELRVGKGNVDYARRTTWASHENFLRGQPPSSSCPALVSHLVSRVVFTGGGGFDPFSRGVPRFVLSPRAMFVRGISRPSPGRLALVDGRDQALCTGFHRQHLACGDANLSQLAMYLRIGTTALVLGLIEAGLDGRRTVRLARPLKALATVARDLTLRQPLDLAAGGQATAIEIQRHFLLRAREHQHILPAWSGSVCDLWQDTLDRLDRGPEAVADRLDWAIKHAIYRGRLVSPGERCLVFGSAARQAAMARRLVGLHQRGAELCEIDVRFGQLYPPGLFASMDAAGVLAHHVSGIEGIEAAVSAPPAEGRAGVRGQVVARLSTRVAGVSCGWDGIRDFLGGRVLDLSDPFVRTETWRTLAGRSNSGGLLHDSLARRIGRPAAPVTTADIRSRQERIGPPGPRAPGGLTVEHANAFDIHAAELRHAGRLEEAERLMRMSLDIDLAVRPANRPGIAHRRNHLATVLLLQGRIAEAREQVRRAWLLSWGSPDVTSLRVLTMRLLIALVSDEPAGAFLGQLKSHLAIQPLPGPAGADRSWNMRPVLDQLSSDWSPDDAGLAAMVLGVVNGDQPVDALDVLPRWRDAQPEPLDLIWPTGSGARRWRRGQAGAGGGAAART